MTAKYERVALALRDDIRRGRFAGSTRLPAEAELAREHGVSRGTIRQALATLQEDGWVRTWTGSGSYVSFDGRRMDEGQGWAAALAAQGVVATTLVTGLGRLKVPGLGSELKVAGDDFLFVERVRVDESGDGISLERSRLPWHDSFLEVIEHGLVEDSLQSTLVSHGLAATRDEESIGVGLLGTEDARLLPGRRAGDPWLNLDRLRYGASGVVVESVRSLLHPDHFRIHHSFEGAR